MDSIGIHEAKSKLSELIDKAEAGEVVTITRRGRPVARIVPVERAEAVDNSATANEPIGASKTLKLKRRLTQREMREMRERGRG